MFHNQSISSTCERIVESVAPTYQVISSVDLAFFVFFSVLLGPLMPAVSALVRVLELLNVYHCRFAFRKDCRRIADGAAASRTFVPTTHVRILASYDALRRNQLVLLTNEFLAYKFDVQSPPTSRAMSEKLHHRP